MPLFHPGVFAASKPLDVANSSRAYADVSISAPASPTILVSPTIQCLVDTGSDYTILPVAMATAAVAAVTVTVIGVLSQPSVVISSVVMQTNRQVRLRHNGGEVPYTVQVSTNLVQWQSLGAPTQISPGLFEFIDTTATNAERRFYRIHTP